MATPKKATSTPKVKTAPAQGDVLGPKHGRNIRRLPASDIHRAVEHECECGCRILQVSTAGIVCSACGKAWPVD